MADSVTPAQLEIYKGGISWDQRPDSADPTFVIITIRAPNEDYPTQRLYGAEAAARIVQWCQNTIQGAFAAARRQSRKGFDE